jgi:hypothetical protein
MRWLHSLCLGSALVFALAFPASAAGPFTLVNLRGPGNETSVSGPCAPDACTATSGHCTCLSIDGTATGSGFGSVSYAMDLTEDTDDTLNVGSNGSECFPVQGDLAITSKPGNTTIGLNGFLCEYAGLMISDHTLNATLTYSQEPALTETKKFATAFGTGSVSLMINEDECTMGGGCASAIYLTGTMQLKH